MVLTYFIQQNPVVPEKIQFFAKTNKIGTLQAVKALVRRSIAGEK
jgi:hypothetical protein